MRIEGLGVVWKGCCCDRGAVERAWVARRSISHM